MKMDEVVEGILSVKMTARGHEKNIDYPFQCLRLEIMDSFRKLHLSICVFFFYTFTSNGGYRREERSRKHWLISIKRLSSVTANFIIC